MKMTSNNMIFKFLFKKIEDLNFKNAIHLKFLLFNKSKILRNYQKEEI